MACGLFVEAPRLETIDGQPVLLARGGRQCTGAPGDNEVSLTLRIRHHRRFQSDRTLAETHGSGVAIDTQVKFDCRNRDKITVFAEVLLPGFFAEKRKSAYVEVRCSK